MCAARSQAKISLVSDLHSATYRFRCSISFYSKKKTNIPHRLGAPLQTTPTLPTRQRVPHLSPPIALAGRASTSNLSRYAATQLHGRCLLASFNASLNVLFPPTVHFVLSFMESPREILCQRRCSRLSIYESNHAVIYLRTCTLKSADSRRLCAVGLLT
jgi:hypothetical protein